MTRAVEKIMLGNRQVSRFITWPKQVRDRTLRCIACGQIDEPEYHTMTCEEAIAHQEPTP